MDPFNRNEERALKEVSLSEMHNRSQFQAMGPAGPRGRTGTNVAGQRYGDAGIMGAHLQSQDTDGDMVIDADTNECPIQGLGAGMHGHTQSCQIPHQALYPNDICHATGKLGKASKGKMMGPQSYQSNVSKVVQPAMTRRSTMKNKNSVPYLPAQARNNGGNATLRNSQVGRNSHVNSTNSLSHPNYNADVPMHNCSTQIASQRSNNGKGYNVSQTAKGTARMQTRSSANNENAVHPNG